MADATTCIFSMNGETFIGGVYPNFTETTVNGLSVSNDKHIKIHYPTKITFEIVEKSESNTVSYYCKPTLTPLIFAVQCVNSEGTSYKASNVFYFNKDSIAISELTNSMINDEIINKWKALTGQ